MDQNKMINEMVNKQLKDVPIEDKMQFSDMKRLCKYFKQSLFDEDGCTVWNGYITNTNNPYKGIYINFYFRRKRVALHRLLYKNYVGHVDNSCFVRLLCKNGKTCCNINHMMKFEKRTYQYPKKMIDDNVKNTKTKNNNNKSKILLDNVNLSVDFDK
jgi:hypothetical protein